MLTTIGISGLNHNLQQVKEPGIYWVNTCSVEAAVYLAAVCAYGAEKEENKADLLIVQPDFLEKLPYYAQRCHDSSFTVLSCAHDERNETSYFADLTNYLSHQKELPRGVIVTADAEFTGHNDPEKARRVLGDLNSFCLKKGVAVLVICYSEGRPDNNLALLLRHSRDYLQGHAELQYDTGGELAYQVLFWRSSHEYYVNQYFFLRQGDQGDLLVVPSTIRQDGVLDEDLIISNSRLLQSGMAGNSNFIYADSIEEVYKRGLGESICYLVFEINNVNELPLLTHSIYTLRRTCGDFLKMAVMLNPNMRLRTHAQRLLIRCGANIVFDHNAGFGYVTVALSALRNAVYSLILPQSYDVIERAQFIMQHRGFVDAETFYELMDIELQDIGLSDLVSGALIILKRKPRTEMRKSITQFIPSRYGDIATAFRNELVVYLLGVSTSNADHALRRLFNMNPNLLFSSIDFYFTYESISREMQQLKGRHYKDSGIIDKTGVVLPKLTSERRTDDRDRSYRRRELNDIEIVTLSQPDGVNS